MIYLAQSVCIYLSISNLFFVRHKTRFILRLADGLRLGSFVFKRSSEFWKVSIRVAKFGQNGPRRGAARNHFRLYRTNFKAVDQKTRFSALFYVVAHDF